MWSSFLRLGVTLAASAALLAAPVAFAQAPAERVLMVDGEAFWTSDTNQGAVFLLDLADGESVTPAVVAAADRGAGWIYPVAAALSPFDGKLYLADLGESIFVSTEAPGRIWSVDAGGTVSLVASGPPLVDPVDLDFLPDGRLAVVDREADPSGLGLDRANNLGHGAVFTVDVVSGAVSLLADGRDRSSMPGFLDGSAAFDEPVAIAYDWTRGVLHVADDVADPLGTLALGSLYSVDPGTGRVALESSSFDIAVPSGLAVLPDGRVLMADSGGEFTPAVLLISPGGDPELNTDILSAAFEGTPSVREYGALEGIAVDGTGRSYLADAGLWELDDSVPPVLVPVVLPRVFQLALAEPPARSIGIVEREVFEFLVPYDIAVVPPFRIDSVSPTEVPDVAPTGCAGTILLVVHGSDLVPALDFDLGPGLAVQAAAFVPGAPRGTQIELTLAPTGSLGSFDVAASHAFGGSQILTAAGTIIDAGPPTGSPGPPCSSRGDASCDGIVDGVDLALLGMHFGQTFCRDLSFLNDVDFTDDDRIDGADLAVLATFFGARP